MLYGSCRACGRPYPSEGLVECPRCGCPAEQSGPMKKVAESQNVTVPPSSRPAPVRQSPPHWAARFLGWIARKIGIIIGIWFILGVYGLAIQIVGVTFNIAARTEYQGLIFVEFVKYGILGIALVIALAATFPFVSLLRRLVK